MSAAWSSSIELLGTWVALVVTLLLFSSLWRDNALSRLAEHLLVGTAAGYAGAVAVRQVLVPRLVVPLLTDPGRNWHLLVPVVLALLWLWPFLVGHRGRRAGAAERAGLARWAGALGLALLFGVGSGLVVGGAWQGTLWPQAWATAQWRPGLGGLLLLITTLSVPLYLHGRLARPGAGRAPRPGDRRPWQRLRTAWERLGQATLLIGLGVIFARAGVARLALLIDRLLFVIEAVEKTGLLGLARLLWTRLVGG